MNKQIKEIALQAANEIADQFKPGFFDNRMVQDVANIIYKHHEQFAELIVNDCVRYLNEDYQRDFDRLWREDLSKGIKEHFGVEHK